MSLRTELQLKAVVQSLRETAGLLKFPGDAVLVSRGRPRWLLLLCPCGCGAELPVNLDSRAGPAWRLYQDQRQRISVYPSVWRDTDCGSHFIIWRDKILLFGDDSGFLRSTEPSGDTADLRAAVLGRLTESDLVSYIELADEFGEIPWDVLDVCRYLARAGILREGTGKNRGTFGRVEIKKQ